MSRKLKYREGPIIEDIGTFDALVNAGGWVYLHGRPKHPAFMCSLPYRVVSSMIRRKLLSVALEREEGGK